MKNYKLKVETDKNMFNRLTKKDKEIAILLAFVFWIIICIAIVVMNIFGIKIN